MFVETLQSTLLIIKRKILFKFFLQINQTFFWYKIVYLTIL